ncbi:UNVERIFIED_CONTAM: hypothetical protein Sradi_6996700 [Sesamum radiatum]|uniref:CCHC-type domain-containing protein n=1 Tax=Sesamum radiatum TaxID=300843 RepID=A0AAW2JBY5_SESRA
MLWDYVEELRRSNPGSTFILSRAVSDGSGGSKFGKLYVCFEGLKMGFLAGCRKIIVLLVSSQGSTWGVMLNAVGIDPNNDSFPIAYAVVGGETRETWEWFLTHLRNDLNIHSDSDYTFMSDKQKGFILAFETVFPTAENRFCVRHLHANMKRVGFKGLSYKKALWKAARATAVTEFEARRKEMQMILKWTYLRVYDPCIYPVNGPEKWNKTNIEPLLPPNPGRQVGRPARARRLEVDERPRKTKKGITVKGIRLKRQQQTLKCRFCGEPGHNKKGCQMRKDAEALIRNEEMEDTENTQNQSQSQTETSFQMNQTNVVSQPQTSLQFPETSKLTQQQQQQAFKPPRKAPSAPGYCNSISSSTWGKSNSIIIKAPVTNT